MVCSITKTHHDKNNNKIDSRNTNNGWSSSNTTHEDTSKSFDSYKQMILNWTEDEKLSSSDSDEMLPSQAVEETPLA